MSFDEPVYSHTPSPLPTNRNGIQNVFLVAPFWDDIDIRRAGNIFYEVHAAFSGNADSLNLLSQVDTYIQRSTGRTFFGSWMVIAQWDMVHPWPHGEVNPDPFLLFFLPDYIQVSIALVRMVGKEGGGRRGGRKEEREEGREERWEEVGEEGRRERRWEEGGEGGRIEGGEGGRKGGRRVGRKE